VAGLSSGEIELLDMPLLDRDDCGLMKAWMVLQQPALWAMALVCLCVVVTHGSGVSSAAEALRVRIDPERSFQVIDGFGASDAWQCAFVGKNWPLNKREHIADRLFSREMDHQGNPKGIVLSVWRFNIGAGTAEQGDGSDIRNPWRRTGRVLGNYAHFIRPGMVRVGCAVEPEQSYVNGVLASAYKGPAGKLAVVLINLSRGSAVTWGWRGSSTHTPQMTRGISEGGCKAVKDSATGSGCS
jgi:O-glycosyl hydrolase